MLELSRDWKSRQGSTDLPSFRAPDAAGETWNVYLDAQSLLPRMVVAQDSRGQLIERYVYREIRENPDDLAAAGAFEPDQRWGESKGLLGRFARAAAGSNLPAPRLDDALTAKVTHKQAFVAEITTDGLGFDKIVNINLAMSCPLDSDRVE